jgi:ribonuclease P protein component
VHTVTYVVATSEDRPARFGFIVSKQVGSAVTRNTVRRRLKAVCAETLTQLAPGTDVVIRALPAAASADFGRLRSEVTRCLNRRVTA